MDWRRVKRSNFKTPKQKIKAVFSEGFMKVLQFFQKIETIFFRRSKTILKWKWAKSSIHSSEKIVKSSFSEDQRFFDKVSYY
jgi:hypothetical protein